MVSFDLGLELGLASLPVGFLLLDGHIGLSGLDEISESSGLDLPLGAFLLGFEVGLVLFDEGPETC